ncbi:MAG: citrate synthase [SAR324 cluster bacterium]|nr:citrate synthase [SAR324 cluster bacterium]MCZ6628535.1 citrate synthase [SAR324 cluster bacterium]MCZ6645367.1 citrate synthase [SAR324 cluster bacterium]
MTQTARLEVNGKSIDLQLTVGTEDEVGMDVSQLRSQTGAITLDYGYANTGSTESAITYIDGEKGILRYRGYPIEQLAEDSSFLEVSYLLNFGELPSEAQLKEFTDNITIHTLLPERMRGLFNGFTKDAHPMGILSSAVTALSTYYPMGEEFSDQGAKLALYRLMGKLPTIASTAYKMSIGQPQIFPNNLLDYTDNLLNMMFALPTGPYDIHPDVARALDVLLILHADHEQNCSTSTVRMVGSSEANVYGAISAGINALWGPLHGGANQAVLEMLDEIQRSDQSLEQFVAEVKDKDSHSRLMGFGHRVYKNFDPRAKIVKVFADKVLDLLGVDDPLLELGKKLEEVALSDDYFIERKLYPNVDFYSGIIYRALGIPVNMFTVMFAIGRLPGWFAHWREQATSNKSKIGRPRQIYTGHTIRDYLPIKERK